MSGDARAREAEAAAARLPPLLVAADRVAAAVAGGVHGRRRAGQGDSFWEYRPLRHGEAAARIDWRRSARDGRVFVRETEWEAAETVCLWQDPSPRLRWRSAAALPLKGDRARLLLLATAALLLRGGERPRLLGRGGLGPSHAGPTALARLADAMPDDAGLAPGVPGGASTEADPAAAFGAVPAHAAAVLFGDFLAPPAETEAVLSVLAARPARGVLVQVLDPAERRLPFRGRVRFRGVAGEAEVLAPRAERLAETYEARLAAHQETLRRFCAGAGFHLVTHDTEEPAERALFRIHEALGS